MTQGAAGGGAARRLTTMLALGMALLAGTVQAAPAKDRLPVELKDDKFSATATIIGKAQMVNPLGGTARIWRLRSWIDKRSMAVTHQLYVDTTYFWHWRFWEAAATDAAEPLEVVPIDRAVESCSGMCSYEEVVGVNIPDNVLRARAATGFEIKLTAHSGDDLVLRISPEQISAQLAAVNAYVAGYMGGAISAAQPDLRQPPSAAPGHVVFGIAGLDLPVGVAATLGKPDLRCAFIARVQPGSVAERGGLLVGDCITSFADQPISRMSDLQTAVGRLVPGASVKAEVARGTGRTVLMFGF